MYRFGNFFSPLILKRTAQIRWYTSSDKTPEKPSAQTKKPEGILSTDNNLSRISFLAWQPIPSLLRFTNRLRSIPSWFFHPESKNGVVEFGRSYHRFGHMALKWKEENYLSWYPQQDLKRPNYGLFVNEEFDHKVWGSPNLTYKFNLDTELIQKALCQLFIRLYTEDRMFHHGDFSDLRVITQQGYVRALRRGGFLEDPRHGSCPFDIEEICRKSHGYCGPGHELIMYLLYVGGLSSAAKWSLIRQNTLNIEAIQTFLKPEEHGREEEQLRNELLKTDFYDTRSVKKLNFLSLRFTAQHQLRPEEITRLQEKKYTLRQIEEINHQLLLLSQMNSVDDGSGQRRMTRRELLEMAENCLLPENESKPMAPGPSN